MMEAESQARPCILWSAISRGDLVLAQATVEDYHWEESLEECANLLLRKKATPGWEFVTYNKPRIRAPMDHPQYPKLKGMKFHIYEHRSQEDEEAEDTSPFARNRPNAGLIIWSISAVYDPCAVDTIQVQSFIQKMVTITQMFRDSDDTWKYGTAPLAAQKQFAPILYQRMSEVSYLGKLCMVQDQVESLKEIMARNIELILERGDRLERLQEQSTDLSHMASIFKKRSAQVKRQMLWQNAKHGLVLGSAITAGVAIVVVPPLMVAL
jgi:Synaptobrevin